MVQCLQVVILDKQIRVGYGSLGGRMVASSFREYDKPALQVKNNVLFKD